MSSSPAEGPREIFPMHLDRDFRDNPREDMKDFRPAPVGSADFDPRELEKALHDEEVRLLTEEADETDDEVSDESPKDSSAQGSVTSESSSSGTAKKQSASRDEPGKTVSAAKASTPAKVIDSGSQPF